MEAEALDKHQLAGLDDRERGFSRPVEFERAGAHYRALLRYETVRITTDPHATQEDALLVLIQMLHAQGYRQLRTQMSFCRGRYLGSQERWVEYQDPPQPEAEPSGFITRLVRWVSPVKQAEPS